MIIKCYPVINLRFSQWTKSIKWTKNICNILKLLVKWKNDIILHPKTLIFAPATAIIFIKNQKQCSIANISTKGRSQNFLVSS